jgi:prepilin-type N-terminal cleavage/methylation domain-containing protein
MMHMREHKGFTLIELMIVIAVTIILVAAVFTVNFRITGLWASERSRSELQQNFRFAADYMATWTRQATSIIQPGLDTTVTPAVMRENVMSDVLEFYGADRDSPTDATKRELCSYHMSGTRPYQLLESTQKQALAGALWVDSGEPTSRPITESIRSLAAVHFIRTGPRVIIILVAEYSLLGSVQTISYTTQTYVRTLNPVEG